jgi:diguanylate cyclase (GGDEF)-like protein
MYEADSRRQMEQLRADAIRTGGGFTLDARIHTARGACRWMRLTAAVAHERGRPIRIFGAKQDVTREKAMWERLRRRAEIDPLTGLANRGVFETEFRELTRSGSAAGGIAALALIDLDHFKQINDRLGHSAGDECLRQLALRLRQAFAEAAVVARIGGDEFAVLLRPPSSPLQLTHQLTRILPRLCQPVLWRRAPIDIGVSIGASLVPPLEEPEPSRLFAEADSALYVAKAAGRNTVRVFGAEMGGPFRPVPSAGGSARPRRYG